MAYGQLKKEDLKKTIDKIFNSHTYPKKERQITCWTGLYGKLTFDFTLKFGGMIKEKYFSTKFKRMPGIRFISLFTKQGLYKLKIENTTFSFYKGTTLIHTIKDVSNNFFLDTLKGTEDNQVKTGIDKVNDYIKQLKDGKF